MRLHLGPLAQSAIVELLTASGVAPTEHLARLARTITDHAKGNPFAIRQSLAALHARGGLVFDPVTDSWSVNPGVDADLSYSRPEDFLGGTLQQLPESAIRVLRSAACLGAQIDSGTLARAMGIPP